MERKIGEIFEHEGEWYQCIKKERGCDECAFFHEECGSKNIKGACMYKYRSDDTDVIFKKLEKVGESYMNNEKIVQKYKIYYDPLIAKDGVVERYVPGLIDIVIKQNQEDMEEKKLNLKPFDLDAAKQGKPVCTRDGRKARIVCFDVKGSVRPIVALISDEEGDESTFVFYENGRVYAEHDTDFDLMMNPESTRGR